MCLEGYDKPSSDLADVLPDTKHLLSMYFFKLLGYIIFY